MAAGEQVRRVLVVGAGIGGLAAATALARRGVDVEIVEARSSFDLGGVGLGQPANGLRALRALGVLDEVLEAGFVFDRLRLFDDQRRPIADHVFLLGGEDVPPFGALPRADLHSILRHATEKAGPRIRMGTTVGHLEDRGTDVEVELSDGSHHVFDLVAGFDGIRSATRRICFGEGAGPVYSGYAAWRLLVPRPAEVTSMEFYQGVGSKTGVMPLRDDLMYLFHIRPEPGNPWHDKPTLVPKLRERLAGYGGVAGVVRDQLADDDDIVYSPIETILITPPWHHGRVVIGGDAAHASPPHLTQGAAMAMEDALVLAEEVTIRPTIAEALATYTERRFGRCRYVQEFSIDMLHREQAVRTAADLEAARRDIAAHMPERLAESDLIMNQRVFADLPEGG